MKKGTVLAAAVVLASLILLAGCHNTGRQIRKTIDGIHDVFLEGSG